MSQRKLRVGMVGGGDPPTSSADLTAARSSTGNSAGSAPQGRAGKPEESLESARELYFTRGYPDWQTLIKQESALPESERIDYLTIVTPNDALRTSRRRRGRGDRGALREAADDHARRGPPPARDRRRAQDPVHRRLHLHRLPDGHARPAS